MVKTKVSHPGKTLEATSSDGTKTIVHTDHGWFLKEKGSSAEPKLLFEELVTSEGKPVQVDASTVRGSTSSDGTERGRQSRVGHVRCRRGRRP